MMPVMRSVDADVVGRDGSYCACGMPGRVGIVYPGEWKENGGCSVELESQSPHGNVMQELVGTAGIRGQAHVYSV